MILWHAGVTVAVLWFVFRGNTRLDYRIAILGALLPDLIDKPIGRIFFASEFNSGRLFGHTLLLNVAFLCVFFFMRGRMKRKLVLLPVGSLLHLAQDAMWDTPEVFWWPLFGRRFPAGVVDGHWLWDALTSPTVVVQEIIGLGLLIWLLAAHNMLSRDGVGTFVRTGHLEQ